MYTTWLWVTREQVNMRRRQQDLKEMVLDRKAELERVNRELDQLVKVKLGQEALLAKMSSAQEEL